MKEKLQQSSRKSLNYRGNECLNCGHPLELSDRYCSYCGQLNSTKRLSLADYVNEFVISVVNYDSRFRYTVKDLLFKPGVITRNFTSGMRMRYANPFRFFLSVSIIYFLISGFIDFIQINELESENNPSLHNLFNFQKDKEKPEIALDSIAYYKDLPVFLFFLAPVFACFFLLLYFKRYSFKHIKKELKNTDRKVIKQLYSIPYLGAFCLYIATCFRKFFVVKRKYNYMEHVIFIFHIFTFLFLVLLLLLIPEFLIGTEFLSGIFISLVAPFYFYKALRNFYQESRLRTIFKFFILNSVFLMLGLIAGGVFFILTAALY